MIKTRLIRLLSDSKKYIVYNIIWQWIALLTQVVIVFTVTNILEQVMAGHFIAAEVRYKIAILIIMLMIRYKSDKMAAKASYGAGIDVKRQLRQTIYDKILRLGTSYQEKITTSEIVQLSTEGVEQLETYFGKYLPQFFYSLLAPLTLFIILSFTSVKASAVLLICVPLIPLSIVAVQKIAKRLLSKYWRLYAKLGDSFLENLQGLTTLKIYQADEKYAKQMDEESDHFRRITMKVLTMQLNSTSVMDIVAYGGAAVGMAVAGDEYLRGNINFAGALTIILLASEFFLPLRLLGSYFHIAMNGMAASDKIFVFLDMEESVKGTKKFPEVNQNIRLDNVHFSYDVGREILKGINVTIPEKSFVCLAGVSGCGKSTIVSMLAGKNKGYTGEITIGDKKLSEISEKELMKNITLVRHNSYLFGGSVRDNLLMAKPDATEIEMQAVLQRVNLWEFMESQNGLDTLLNENAGNLSGGQCQRLALARALLHNTPIYIFDEATSNIDVESEEMIMKVITELAKIKTVILISHRLANVVDSDKIYVLKEGVITEYGTHQDLMDARNDYYEMYRKQRQLEGYMSEDRDEEQSAEVL